MIARDLWGGKYEEVDQEEILGQWSYSVKYKNVGHMSSYIFSNS